MNLHRIFAIACLGLASVVGCGAEVAEDVDAVQTQADVVHYGAEDFASLRAGEMLRVDLTAPNTVYVIEYNDASLLDRVNVTETADQYVLGTKLAGASSSAEGTGNRVILSGDPALAKNYAGLAHEEHKKDAVMSTADEDLGEAVQPLRICCAECHPHPGGIVHCTGCGFC
jgi:hypothetical protein